MLALIDYLVTLQKMFLYVLQTASFQLILATDGQIAFAILNYDSVWSNTQYGGGPLVSYSYSGVTGGSKEIEVPGLQNSLIHKSRKSMCMYIKGN